jgi:hypothetical protein
MFLLDMPTVHEPGLSFVVSNHLTMILPLLGERAGVREGSCLPSPRGCKLKALKGRPIVARGKRESVSAPPRVNVTQILPHLSRNCGTRDSANLICGLLPLVSSRPNGFIEEENK